MENLVPSGAKEAVLGEGGMENLVPPGAKEAILGGGGMENLAPPGAKEAIQGGRGMENLAPPGAICYLFVRHLLPQARIHLRRGSLSPVYRIGRDAAPQSPPAAWS